MTSALLMLDVEFKTNVFGALIKTRLAASLDKGRPASALSEKINRPFRGRQPDTVAGIENQAWLEKAGGDHFRLVARDRILARRDKTATDLDGRKLGKYDAKKAEIEE